MRKPARAEHAVSAHTLKSEMMTHFGPKYVSVYFYGLTDHSAQFWLRKLAHPGEECIKQDSQEGKFLQTNGKSLQNYTGNRTATGMAIRHYQI